MLDGVGEPRPPQDDCAEDLLVDRDHEVDGRPGS